MNTKVADGFVKALACEGLFAQVFAATGCCAEGAFFGAVFDAFVIEAAATVLAIEATLCEPLASGGEPRRLASLVRTLARTVHGEPLTDFSTDFSIDQEL